MDNTAIIERHVECNHEEAHEKLVAAAQLNQKSMMQIAFYGWRVERDELWKNMGHESMEEYIDALHIPKQSWNTYTRIGRIMDLSSVPWPVMEKIPCGNALLLLDIPSAMRTEHDWITEAITMKQKDFAKLLDSRIERDEPGFRRMKKFVVSMSVDQMERVREILEAYRGAHELETIGEALERLATEWRDTH